MIILDFIAAAYWPTIAGLVLVGLIFRRFPWISVRAITIGTGIGIIGFFVAAFADLDSLWVMLDAQIGLILFGAGSIALAYLGGREMSLNWRLRLTFLLLGIGFVGLGSQMLIGDYLLARETVAGTVQKLYVLPRGLMPDEHVVVIDGRQVAATSQLYGTLRVGARVRAEVGQGTGYIFRLQTENAH